MKKPAARFTRVCTLLGMLGLLTALLLAATAQAVASAKPTDTSASAVASAHQPSAARGESPSSASGRPSAPGSSAETMTGGAPVAPRPADQAADGNPVPVSVVTEPRAQTALRSSPIMFIENVGQFDERALFQVRGAQGTIHITENAVWYTLLEPRESRPAEYELPDMHTDSQAEEEPRRGVNLKLSFVGANPHPYVVGFNRLDTKVSYFIGNDPDEWYADVPVWGGVRLVNLYPGIHLELTQVDGQWQQGWIVQEGADLSAVGLRIDGAEAVSVDTAGRVRLTTEVGTVVEGSPLLVAESSLGLQETRPLGVRVSGNEVTFVRADAEQSSPVGRPSPVRPGARPATAPAPTADDPPPGSSDLVFSTFLGGYDEDYAYGGLAVYDSGAVCVAGTTESPDFPTTPGAFDTTFSYTWEGFVAKVNSAGTDLIYSTFLGGEEESDWVGGVAVGDSGEAYVTGTTVSSDFPTTPGAYDTSFNGDSDAFVAKLNSDGTDLVCSTFLGGEYEEDWCGIALGNSGETYVTGLTGSPDYPTTSGAYDTTFNGEWDAFIAKLNAAGSALQFSTFLGSTGEEAGSAIAVDGSGNTYVAGYTESGGFPTTPGAYDTGYNGEYDTFVAKLNPQGTDLVYSTFLGGAYPDFAGALAVDDSAAVYVAGETQSSDFPTTVGAYDTTLGGPADAYATKLNPCGSELEYSTFVGGTSQDGAYGIAVDSLRAAWVSGETDSSDFPATPCAFDETLNGGCDGFVAKLSPDATLLAYATYLGGSDEYPDTAYGIAVDTSGAAYAAGVTDSSDFPTTPGAFDTTYNEGGDAFVAKFAIGIDPDHYLGICPSVAQCGDPVNTSTGNFAHQRDDLSIPGPGVSFSVQRTYNSIDSYEGPLGEGWSLSYDMRLTSMVTDVVEMKVEDGRRDTYVSSDGETFVSPPGVNATFVRNEDDSYTLTREDQTRYNFNEDGYLTSIVTSNELSTTLTYSGTRLTNVTEPAGRTITFTWGITNTRITGIEDPLGRTVVYTYTGGDLISVADLRGNVATYAYTGTNGLLSSLTEPGQSTPFTVNEYNEEGRVTSQWLAESSQPMTFEYQPENRRSVITDSLGHTQVHTYSLQLPLTDREDSYGNKLSLTLNSNNDLTSVTNELGYTTVYTYDGSGNVTAIVDALGHEQTMTYDDHNNLTAITDTKGEPTFYQYDDQDNLTATIQTLDGSPITTTFTYYDEGAKAGLLQSRTDPLGHTTSYGYDAYGNMTVITDALGNVTTYTYDLAGRRTTESVTKDGQPHTVYYTYDEADNLTTITQTVDSEVVTTSYEYDEVGNRQTMDSPGGQVDYTYDAANRLTSVGGVAYTWDANGNLTSDGLRSYSYDHANRLTQVVSGTLTTQYAYNGDGVRTSKTVDATTTQYVLDLAATLPVVISDTEAVYLYGLDIIAQQQAEMLYYVHDGLGSVRQLVDSTGDVSTSYAYDPFGVPLTAGETYNPYQYTGEAWDAEVGLLYLRARYYQPETGRFIGRDPAAPDPQQPSASHGWVYVANNPSNVTDPSGMAPSVGEYEGPAGTGQTLWDDRNLTWWLYQELVTNVDGPDARQIRQLWNSRNPLDRAAGAMKWINLVADGCRWDFKDRIHDVVGDTIMLRHIAGARLGYRWYEYSVPGNIFFGWMGMAVGFPAWMLHVGAAYAEVTDPEHQTRGDCTITGHVSHQLGIDLLGAECELELDVCINPHWWRTMLEEPGDYWNVEFGIQLYMAHGPHPSFAQFYAYLGEKGWWLTGASQPPENVGRQFNKQWPYHPGYFSGSGCGEGPFRCRQKQ